MSKAVLISIRPKWCEKIANGNKTIEVRRTRPKIDTPFKCYIYCTAGDLSYKCPNGMICHCCGGWVVIGEFICDRIALIAYDGGELSSTTKVVSITSDRGREAQLRMKGDKL